MKTPQETGTNDILGPWEATLQTCEQAISRADWSALRVAWQANRVRFVEMKRLLDRPDMVTDQDPRAFRKRVQHLSRRLDGVILALRNWQTTIDEELRRNRRCRKTAQAYRSHQKSGPRHVSVSAGMCGQKTKGLSTQNGTGGTS